MDVAGARFRCRGCGQLLTFDEHGNVPREQLAACLGRCNWSRVEDPPPTAGPAGVPPTADSVGAPTTAGSAVPPTAAP